MPVNVPGTNSAQVTQRILIERVIYMIITLIYHKSYKQISGGSYANTYMQGLLNQYQGLRKDFSGQRKV